MMGYLIVAFVMFGAGVGTTYWVMSARVAVVTERNHWLEQRVSTLAKSITSSAARINDMIANPALAVRANTMVMRYVAKGRYGR